MQISVTEAKGRLTELLRLAEEGGEVILTRDRPARKAAIEAIREAASKKAKPGPDSARSQDFLYGEGGLPK